MNYVMLYAATAGYDFGLNYTAKVVADTFDELNISVEQLNLGFIDIPYFDGVSSSAVENVFKSIERSDGAIFAMTASKSAPCALMQTFIEHFDFNIYKNPFEKKNCFIIILSKDESQIRADEYITQLLYSSGAFPVTHILAGSRYVSLFGKDESVKEMIEKYAEDFYRMRNRKFFINSSLMPAKPKESSEPYLRKEEKSQNSFINDFNKKQEDDISELTRLFSKQYKAETEGNNTTAENYKERNALKMSESYKTQQNYNKHNNHKAEQNYSKFDNYKPEAYGRIVPSMKTCKQKTQNLHHYFQPQYADNINAVIQINISGEENFSGYVTFFNGLCSYDEGRHSNPDVIILADTKIWNDILDAKYTVQKAFMIGQIKVKGNFMLLSHFDKVFKLKQQ